VKIPERIETSFGIVEASILLRGGGAFHYSRCIGEIQTVLAEVA